MSKSLDKISNELFQKIRNVYSPVSLSDEKAEPTIDPEKARYFDFQYKEGKKEIGQVTVSILDNRSLKVFFSTDLVKNVTNKPLWFKFLKNLRFFSKRNLLNFEARDIVKDQLSKRDIKVSSNHNKAFNISDIPVNESVMFGSKRKSYQTVESVRIIVNHKKTIDEDRPGARSRYIESIFLERSDGERYKFPYNYLTGARAMARHVVEGGTPYDNVGQYIVSTIKEMKNLSKFARKTKKIATEGSNTFTVRESVVNKYKRLKHTLGALSNKHNYDSFVSNFTPSESTVNETELNELKEKFTQRVFDNQMEELLPSVYNALKEDEMNTTTKNLLLRKDDAADQMFRSTKFTDGSGLLSFILSDIASRIIGDGADEIANFASDAAERLHDRDYPANLKQKAMVLAKQYIDDVKRMSIDPAFKEVVRVDPTSVYGNKKKRDGSFHEARVFESWANNLLKSLDENAINPNTSGINTSFDSDNDNPAEAAVLRRIKHAHLDLIKKYGLDAVLNAVQNVTSDLHDIDEVGSSDTSIWVNQVVKELESSVPVKEAAPAEKKVTLRGREVDVASLKIDGIDKTDYPEFCDAFYSDGKFIDGTDIDEFELDRLRELYPDMFYDKINGEYIPESNDDSSNIDSAFNQLLVKYGISSSDQRREKRDNPVQTKEAAPQGTVGTQGTQGTNNAQAKPPQNNVNSANNINRLAKNAGLKTNTNDIKKALDAQQTGAPLPGNVKKTVTDLGNELMQVASDNKNTSQLSNMLKKAQVQTEGSEALNLLKKLSGL